jgi:hypothetical protein
MWPTVCWLLQSNGKVKDRMQDVHDRRRPTRFANLSNPGKYFLILIALVSLAAGLSYALNLL